MKKFFLLFSLQFIFIYCYSQETGTFTDKRDGQIYKTVKIGSQIWMAQNLAFKPDSGKYWAYDNNQEYVLTYGYLYNWETALKVVPEGWHIPSDAEWKQLAEFLEHKQIGKRLKSKNSWNKDKNKDGNGIDAFGFNAIAGGCRFGSVDTFDKLGIYGDWWTSTQKNNENAWCRAMINNSDQIYRTSENKHLGFSVRCIKN